MNDQLVVAIPNYMGGKFITETLRSLANNRPHARWWLQDACSSDTSCEIAFRYKSDEDIIQVEPDRGQADALNKAFAQMGGDIIGFLNSDDLLTPDAAATVLQAFKKNPEVDLVYGEVEWIDAQGIITGHHAGDISSYEEIIDIYEVWWKERQWVQPEVFFRRSLFEKVGLFNTNLELAFDYEYWVRCLAAGARVMRLPKVLSRFRIHAGQKSSRADQASREIRTVVSHWLRHGPKIQKSQYAKLSAQLSFDAWRLGETQDSAFHLSRAILTHPEWLRLSGVPQRICTSLRCRLCFPFKRYFASQKLQGK